MENGVKIAYQNIIMATTKERKTYTAQFKAKVALEVVRGKLTINQIAQQFSVHPNQISKWKKQFLESLPQIFDSPKKANNLEQEELINQLYQQLGQLKVELAFGEKKICPFRVMSGVDTLEPEKKRISVRRQCELLGLNRSGLYYRDKPPSEEDAILMRILDEQYRKPPFYGYRRMTAHLQRLGYRVNQKRVRRLMSKLGVAAIYPQPKRSLPSKEHLVYPYLLRDIEIEDSDQVWATDITYIRLEGGFVYLLVIMHWYSRFVIEIEVSNSLESSVFVETLKRAMTKSVPQVFNSDQGSQFTAVEWLKVLQANGIRISMDGRGRCFDNIRVERLWRTVKYEEVYLKDYQDVWEADDGLRNYFSFYNMERPHQSLKYQTPFEVYQKGLKTKKMKEEKEAVINSENTP